MRRHVLGVMLGVCLLAWLVASATIQADAGSYGFQRPVDVAGQAPSSGAGYHFPAFWVDAGQNTHLFWSDRTESGAALFHASDASGRWSAPVDVVSTPDSLILRTSVQYWPTDGRLYVFWQNLWIGGSVLYASVPANLVDDPRAWSTPAAFDALPGTPQIGPRGGLHSVYGIGDGGNSVTLYHVRLEDTQEQSEPQLILSRSFPVPTGVSIRYCIDARNRIHVGLTFRSDEYGEFSEVGYVRSPDGGRSWDSYRLVQSMGTTWQGVSTIVPFAFGEDELHLTWHDPRRMHMRSLDGGETWGAPVEIISLGAAFGGANELVKDSAGTLYAVTAVQGGVFVSQWRGAGWSLLQQIDNRDFDPHSQRLAISQGNRLHIAYHDGAGPNTVWYANLTTGAPIIARGPIQEVTTLAQPTAAVEPTVQPTPTMVDANAREAPPFVTEAPAVTDEPSAGVLLRAIWPVPVIFGALVAFHRGRGQR